MSLRASHRGNACRRASASGSRMGSPKGNAWRMSTILRSTAFARPDALIAKERTSSTPWSTAACGVLPRKTIS